MMRQIAAVDEKVGGLQEHIQTLGTILGIGCSHHMSSVREWLKDHNENDYNDSLELGNVKLGNEKYSLILGYGALGRFSSFTNELFVPDVDANIILSVGQYPEATALLHST